MLICRWAVVLTFKILPNAHLVRWHTLIIKLYQPNTQPLYGNCAQKLWNYPLDPNSPQKGPRDHAYQALTQQLPNTYPALTR